MNIPVDLPSSPIKIIGPGVLELWSDKQTDRRSDKQRLQLHKVESNYWYVVVVDLCAPSAMNCRIHFDLGKLKMMISIWQVCWVLLTIGLGKYLSYILKEELEVDMSKFLDFNLM